MEQACSKLVHVRVYLHNTDALSWGKFLNKPIPDEEFPYINDKDGWFKVWRFWQTEKSENWGTGPFIFAPLGACQEQMKNELNKILLILVIKAA
jgi:hypothetical protein